MSSLPVGEREVISDHEFSLAVLNLHLFGGDVEFGLGARGTSIGLYLIEQSGCGCSGVRDSVREHLVLEVVTLVTLGLHPLNSEGPAGRGGRGAIRVNLLGVAALAHLGSAGEAELVALLVDGVP